MTQAAKFQQALEFHQRGQLPEAERGYQDVLQADARHADANHNLAVLLYQRGDIKKALEQVDLALTFNPDSAACYNTRGVILKSLKRITEAQKAFDKALAIQPDFIAALQNQVENFMMMNKWDEALASGRHAFALNARHDYAEGKKIFLELLLCDWTDYQKNIQHILERQRRGENAALPFELIPLPSTAEDQLKCAQAFISSKHPPKPPMWKGERYDHKKIRIAYLSANYNKHAVAYLMAGLFEHHDRTKFETIGLSYGVDDKSDIRKRLMANAFDEFIDVRAMTDEQVAQLIREKEIDIAVDLMGVTQDCRMSILASRCAPVQVNYLGYPGTLGAAYIDYIIADRIVAPPEMQHAFAEKIVYMPDSYQPNDNKRVIPQKTPTRAELGLPEKAFVFCCFNNNFKITPEIFDIWMRLLKAVEGSVLWLLEATKTTADNLRREAQQRGVAPERLVFAPRVTPEEHLARHRQADLFLDTLPCNAHTTASDALWTGLPVITCLGQAFAGRVAGSLLYAANMPELVTQSLAEYEQLALHLARDHQVLAAVKEKLAKNLATCSLFDTKRFAQNLEAAYTKMWERAQRGEAPASFEV
jgi:protein O-GlcNAc transferase